MKNNSSISIILPVFNEECNIKQTLQESFKFLEHQNDFRKFEIVVVDDGSTDETFNILSELKKKWEGLKVVVHVKNIGYGRALVSGVKQAQFPWVLFMDADGQFKVSTLAELKSYMEKYDIITGYRFKRNDTLSRIILGRIYTWLIGSMFGLKLRDINCGFKLYNREKFDATNIHCHAGAFYTDFFIQAKIKGCRIKEVPVEHFPRSQGKETGANSRVIFEAMRDVFRLKFSNKKNDS